MKLRNNLDHENVLKNIQAYLIVEKIPTSMEFVPHHYLCSNYGMTKIFTIKLAFST